MSEPDGERPRTPELPEDYREVFLSQVSVVTIAEPPRRNSPLVLFAVLCIVLVGIAWIAVLGKVTSGGLSTTVEGVAYAVGENGVGERPRADPGSLTELAANPVLTPGGTPRPTTCELPDLDTGAGELESYYRKGITCLDEAWRPVLTSVNLPFRSPGLNIADDPRTKCGFAPHEDEATAFYCARDKVIYMPRERLIRDAGDETAYHLAVLAHEYGHHVQAQAGILRAVQDQERAADEDEMLELSRRVELQANCFAGAFLAAVAGNGSVDLELAQASVDSFNDTMNSDTHGSRKNQAAWAKAGFTGKSSASCNTWQAPSDEVK
ncbi:neutral zinc metallopeptidase [Actinokineospora sp.]|uniref:neutral zinc metallopeptidase n=1 Tax=Actinokineospora sp. TaxID=1872133 RepID=UPI003D6A6040